MKRGGAYTYILLLIYKYDRVESCSQHFVFWRLNGKYTNKRYGFQNLLSINFYVRVVFKILLYDYYFHCYYHNELCV